jgi:sugar lactone lactonase YvrE
MNIRPLSLPSALLVLCLAGTNSFAQREDAPNQNPEQDYNRTSEWAQVPGGEWDGSTSWITVDGKGLVYVLVRAKPYLRIFRRDGSFVKSMLGDIDIGNAHSVTIDTEGNFWISDAAEHVILKFNPEGELLMTLGTPGEAGDNSDRDRFNQPNHVFIADNGDIYVSDGYRNSRVVHFTPGGEYIRHIGGTRGSGPGEFQAVHGVALDSEGRIIVNDSENFRVNVFDPDGNFIESWPIHSRGGIEVRDGDIFYISDVNEGTVNIVNRDGEVLDTAYALRAHGLAVDTDGSIYTSGASRMTVWKLTHK